MTDDKAAPKVACVDAVRSAAAGGLDERSRPPGESSRQGGAAAGRSGRREPCAIVVPAIHDLANRLRFAPSQGRIWLDDQRMMLMHVTSLGALRQELIESLGKETARGLLTRIGYQAGARDAEMAKKLRSGSSAMDHFLAGPQLVSLEGIVHCEPLALDIDVGSGRYFGDFALIDCAEAEAHLASYGVGDEPTCWMLVGYACGYTSTFMGRPILWREVECRGMGHDRCRVVGRPVEEWGEGDRDDLRFLQIGDFVKWTAASPPNATARLAARPASGQENSFGMVGISSGFNTVCHMVRKVAPTEATVLFLGESGVGKEIFSKNLHRLSKRANGPFIAVNCAAIPDSSPNRSCSASRRADSPARPSRAPAASSARTAAPCSSTRSAR